MKLKSNDLTVLFNTVNRLIERMNDNPHYDEEIKSLFSNAIPKMDMTKDEVEKHFRDRIRMTQMLSTKLQGWFEGFLNDHLKHTQPYQLFNENIIRNDVNPPLSVSLLKKIYSLKQSDKTIYNWIKKDKLIPSSNSGTRLYFKVDFEHLLRNKGIPIDREKVEEIIAVTDIGKSLNS